MQDPRKIYPGNPPIPTCEPCIDEDFIHAQQEEQISRDLAMTDPSEMSEEVKDAVIRHFQQSAGVYQDRYEMMQRNAESAYKQARDLEQAYSNLVRESQAKIQLLKQNIATVYQNSLIVKLGE
jgi:hypothetical protein